MIQLGATQFDASARLLRDSKGSKIALRPQTCKVLECLVRADGEAVSKDQLTKAVWGKVAVTDDSLVQCIGEIRTAIGDERHEILQTEWRRGYRLALPPAQANASAIRAEPVEAPGQAQGEQVELLDGQYTPAIAVIAFTSLDGDERSERQAAAFSADLISELARNIDIRVISRVSAFSLVGQNLGSKEICEKLHARFLVTGQVQFSDKQIRCSLEFVDGQNGQIVLSERKLFDLPDDCPNAAPLIQGLAGAIIGCHKTYFWRSNLATPDDELSAYELTSKVYGTFIFGNSPNTTRQAQRLAALAVEKHPNYGRAWRVLAHSHSFDIVYCHTGEWTDERADEALMELQRSIDLEPDNPQTLTLLADLLLSAGRLEEAVLVSNQALEFASSDPTLLNLRSLLLFHAGRFAEARTVAESFLTMLPNPPSQMYSNIGRILWVLGSSEKAHEFLQKAIALSPGSNARITLIVASHERGEHDLAAKHYNALLTHTSGFDERYFGRRWNAIPELRDRYVNALRIYGLKPAVSGKKRPLALVK